jgi:hypothetical protein
MGSDWIVEATDGETWREASRLFRDWLSANAPLQEMEGFGWNEGDPVSLGGCAFHGFHIPEHHGSKVSLFGQWAKAAGRRYGQEVERAVCLSDESEVVLLPMEQVEVPPWLKK